MTHEDTMFQQRAREYVEWGSRLSPEERSWRINVLLPAVIACLRDAADAATARVAAEEVTKQAAE
ncbi:MAG: hypothetical protein M3R02_30650 [Chloroflexota bacterium]|nr:hypothetical protein [Chloroflexota bacterium]